MKMIFLSMFPSVPLKFLNQAEKGVVMKGSVLIVSLPNLQYCSLEICICMFQFSSVQSLSRV